MEYLYIDTETTGANSEINTLYELDLKYVKDWEIVDQLQFWVELDGTTQIQLGTLEAGFEFFHPEAIPEHDAVFKLNQFLQKNFMKNKISLAGFNVWFDERFFNNFCTKNNINIFGYLQFPSLCIYNLAGRILRDERQGLFNLTLKHVAKFLGIEVDDSKLHGASYDNTLALQVHKELEKRITIL